MKPEEAIRFIRNLPTMCVFTDAYGEPIDSDAYYEAVDAAISALEKQIEKKPIEDGKLLLYKCPICKKLVYDYGRYCVACGCKFDWSEYK